GQKVHLDLAHTVALARFTAPTFDVEREPARRVAPQLGLRKLREKTPNLVEGLDVRGRVAARGPPDGALIDVDDLVDQLEPLDGSVFADMPGRVVQLAGEGGVEHAVHECGLAGAADSGDAGELSYRELHVQIFQAVLARSEHADHACGWPRAARRADRPPPGQICAGQCLFTALQASGSARVDHAAPSDACARPEVDHVIG